MEAKTSKILRAIAKFNANCIGNAHFFETNYGIMIVSDNRNTLELHKSNDAFCNIKNRILP